MPDLFQLLKKSLILFFLFYALSSNAQQSTTKTEILWDHYGVPHIFANSNNEMYYAFGWAQMHNHANLLLKLYGQARGRAAEYWGKDMLQSDQEVHLFNLTKIAKNAYSQQKPEYKGYLDAFVKGINAYAAAHPEAIASEMKPVLPVTVEDVLAHSTHVICLVFLGGEDIEEAFQ
ncbi:MAG TPA: penicillin acylase family protein, partial [Flavisolibacter sp.]|nr:penicillin acylase family protein [Flavisolibacter sp.]